VPPDPPCFDFPFHGLVFFGTKIHGAKKHEIDLNCQARAQAAQSFGNRAPASIFRDLRHAILPTSCGGYELGACILWKLSERVVAAGLFVVAGHRIGGAKFSVFVQANVFYRITQVARVMHVGLQTRKREEASHAQENPVAWHFRNVARRLGQFFHRARVFAVGGSRA
jgi:hypothetical protein